MKYQRKDLAQFPHEIRYAVEHYKPSGFKIEAFDNIILGGLGGSGIAGRIAKSLFSRRLPIPVEVLSAYQMPEYAGKRTLTILNSYSGNTEETLAMYDEARQCGTAIIVLTTGGKLAEMATADGYPMYFAEKGFQPRMSLGYSLSYLLMILSDLIGENIHAELLNAASVLDDENKYIKEADAIFSNFRKVPLKKVVAVTDILTYPVGIRMEQQIEENAKSQAFVHMLPEANHNVIESYYGDMDSAFIFLNSHSHSRVELRFGFLAQLLRSHGNTVVEVSVEPTITGIIQAIYTLDWLSLLMADFKGVNSSNIQNINALKKYLSEN
jgi:glucose/mannose-6-phosphate isomerase